jgi:hypothetical protein
MLHSYTARERDMITQAWHEIAGVCQAFGLSREWDRAYKAERKHLGNQLWAFALTCREFHSGYELADTMPVKALVGMRPGLIDALLTGVQVFGRRSHATEGERARAAAARAAMAHAEAQRRWLTEQTRKADAEAENDREERERMQRAAEAPAPASMGQALADSHKATAKREG